MLRNLCHRLDVRETFQRALPYHGKQQVALRLAFCPELRLGLFHLNDCPISLPSEMGLDLCGRLCHSCCVDPRHSSSVAAQGLAIPRRTLQRSRSRDLAGFWDSFWPHSFANPFLGNGSSVQQFVSLTYYRISAPPEVEELLLGGLTEPTWLSPWLLSAEGEVVQDLSCV